MLSEKAGWRSGRSKRSRLARGRDVRGALAVLGRAHHRRDVAQVVGPEHEVDLGEAREQRVALLLGDAAADPEQAPRAQRLPFAEPAEVAVEAVLGLLADRAGVDHQQVGASRARPRPRSRCGAADSRPCPSRGRSSGTRRCGSRRSGRSSVGNLSEPRSGRQSRLGGPASGGIASVAKSRLTPGWSRGHNAKHQVRRSAARPSDPRFERFWSGGG